MSIGRKKSGVAFVDERGGCKWKFNCFVSTFPTVIQAVKQDNKSHSRIQCRTTSHKGLMGIQSRLNYCDNIDVQLPPRLNTNSFQLRQGLNVDQVWAKNIKLCPLNILDEVSFFVLMATLQNYTQEHLQLCILLILRVEKYETTGNKRWYWGK